MTQPAENDAAHYPARAHNDCTPGRCLVAEVAGDSERDKCVYPPEVGSHAARKE